MKYNQRELRPGAILSLALAAALAGAACEPTEEADGLQAKIVRFEATPAQLEAPGEVSLRWETVDATSITLHQGDEAIELGAANPAEGSVSLFIDATTDFVLSARGPAGKAATATLHLVVGELPLPTIGSFTAPEAVEADEAGAATALLRWSAVVGAQTLSLVAEPGGTTPLDASSPDGEREVSIAADTHFTLIARNASGGVQESASVRVIHFPEILEFAANRRWIGTGEEVELSWVTRGAAEVELFVDGSPVEELDPIAAEGSHAIAPLISSTVELRASDELGRSVVESLEIFVGAPEAHGLSGSIDKLWLGGEVTLSGESEGASRVRIFASGIEEPICESDEIGALDHFVCTWTPERPGNHELTLSASNTSGIDTATWPFFVADGPFIETFTISPTEASFGDTVEMSWAVLPDPAGNEASLLLLDDQGNTYPVQSQAGIEPLVLDAAEGLMRYTLRATTADARSLPQEATVEVMVHGKGAVTLVSDPPIFDDSQVDAVELRWTSENAVSLVLYRIGPDGPEEFLVIPEEQRAEGSISFVPEETTAFRLVGINAAGAESRADVVVEYASLAVVSFKADPTSLVLGQPVELSWVTRSSEAISLDIFDGAYVRSETSEPFVDLREAGGTFLPLEQSCGSTRCANLVFQNLSFPFDGSNHQELRIFGNGFASFDLASAQQPSAPNTAFPSEAGSLDAQVHLAPFWDELDWDATTYPQGNVHYLLANHPTKGRHAIIQWADIAPAAHPAARMSFQIVLWSSGAFEYRYGPMDPGPAPDQAMIDAVEGRGATIGYQSPNDGHWDMRQFNRELLVWGSLEARTFLYDVVPELQTSGSYTWYPYTNAPTAAAKLRVERDGEVQERTLTVLANGRPEFRLHQRPPASLEVGTSFRVGWNSFFANQMEVIDQDGVARCSATHPQAVSEGFCTLVEATEGIYTYTIRASGAHGSQHEKSITVRIHEPFGIESFTADDLILEHGESVELSWVTYNTPTLQLFANGVEIPLAGPPTGPGSVVVSDLDVDTTFVLRATNAIGVFVEETVEVEMWKVRLELTPSATQVRPGAQVTVRVDATPLDGSGPPVIYGTLPMVEVQDAPAYTSISTLEGATSYEIPSGLGHVEIPFPEGFRFPYFGEEHQLVRMYRYGYVSFGDAPNASNNLPMPTEPHLDQIHIAPFWENLSFVNGDSLWAHAPDPDTFILEWKGVSRISGSSGSNAFDLNFQLVLFRSGAFEFRYGAMSPPPNPNPACNPSSCVNEANGSSATIGFQGRGGATLLHYGGTEGIVVLGSSPLLPPFPGGLSNRTFRYAPLVGSGELTFTPVRSGRYVLCTTTHGQPACKDFEIEAAFGLSSFEADRTTIGVGESTKLRWTSFGGTELRVLDGDGTVIFGPTTDPAQIDDFSIDVSPAASTTYRIEVEARSNIAVATADVQVARVHLTATAPASMLPGQTAALSWDLSVPDPNIQPIVLTPMEEVQNAPFGDYDLTLRQGATVIWSSPTTQGVAPVDFGEGFTFDFFGTQYDRAYISVEGYLSFDSALTNLNANNVFPGINILYQRIHMAPFWDDLAIYGEGRVLAMQVDPDTFVIQWSNVSTSRGSYEENYARLNFQIVLRRNGDFEFRYGAMTPPPQPATDPQDCYPINCINEVNGSSATIGYQTQGGAYAFALNMGPAHPSPDAWPIPGGLSHRTWRYTRTSASGSVQIAPWDTRYYSVCAMDASSKELFCNDSELEVIVPWGITSFEATPAALEPGQQANLEWSLKSADRIRLYANETLLVDHQGAQVQLQDSHAHTPTQDTVYTLELTSFGRVVRESRLVQPRGFDLSINLPLGRLFPGDEVELSWNLVRRDGREGAAGLLSPMTELPAGPGEPGQYVDISGLPGVTELIPSHANTGYAEVILPFSFPYFGKSFGRIQVYVDGYISFVPSTATGMPTNTPLPNASGNNSLVHIAPFWDDLWMRGPDKLLWHSPDPDTAIIQWSHFNRSSGSSASVHYDLNFQLVLHSDGRFDYRYGTMAPPPQPFSNAQCWPSTCELEAEGSSATIGYQTEDARFGYMLHLGGNAEAHVVPFPGGLSNRGFRFNPALTGTARIRVGTTQDLLMCGFVGAFEECQTVRIRPVADPGELMITELMIDPLEPDGHWFEVRNLGDEVVDLEGFVIQTNSGSHVIASSVPVPPRGFAVLAASAQATPAPDYVYGTELGFAKEVDTLELAAGAATISSVSWGPTWFVPAGRALSLDPQHHWRGVLSNDEFEQWCELGFDGSPGYMGEGCANLHYDLDPSADLPYLDISDVGIRVRELEVLNGYARIDVPGFSFPIFDQLSTKVWAAAGGWVSLADQDPEGGGAGSPAPGSPKPPNIGLPRPDEHRPLSPLLAPFWSGLRCTPTAHDCVFRYSFGEVEGADVLVLEWVGFRVATTPGGATFQVQLWEDGDIVFAYDEFYAEDLPFTTGWNQFRGANAWIAIEDVDRSNYITALHRQAVGLSHRVLHFKRK